MQWEYCEVDFRYGRLIYYEPTESKTENIKKVSGDSGLDTRSRLVSKLGLDGWEMVAVGVSDKYNKVYTLNARLKGDDHQRG